MGSPAARSVALHAVRCLCRQLNSGVVDQQIGAGVVASGLRVWSGGVASGGEEGGGRGVEDVRPHEILIRTQEVDVAWYGARDNAILHLEGLIRPSTRSSKNLEPWNHSHLIQGLCGSETRVLKNKVPGLPKVSALVVDDLVMNSAQREQKEVLVRSGRDLPRNILDRPGNRSENSSLASVVADCSVGACRDTGSEQATRPKSESGLSRLVSLVDSLDAGCGFSMLQQDNISFECDSVKRKRKKKMNKHKQRKLRRRDRHRN